MTRRRLSISAMLVFAPLVATVALVVQSREASLHRTWDEDVRILTGVSYEPDGSVTLAQIRDWRYTHDVVESKEYFAHRYDADDLQRIWLYEQELGLGGAIAHTFLVFEFPEEYGAARWLGLSVETRRELGETYSLIRGVLRGFEVTHMWATEEDLVRRRVVHLDYPLTRYEVTIPDTYLAPLFRRFVDETAALAETPRWYNTLTTNCTSSLIRYVNRQEPGAIPWDPSFILTGRVDDYLGELGYVDLASGQRITREWLADQPVR